MNKVITPCTLPRDEDSFFILDENGIPVDSNKIFSRDEVDLELPVMKSLFPDKAF